MNIDALRGKRILIVGYGREGKATEQFLRKHVPDARIGITDAAHGPNYLEVQQMYDLAIRSPGVPKHLITIPHTTATNIFFSMRPGTTIGITGTKGKSTTTALLYHILRSAGKNAVLAGNIGIPVLEAWQKHQDERPLYVLELSSYMLDDFIFAPDYALTVSLYPDHLDYHGSLEAYYEAKHNLVSRMQSGVYVYNPKFPEFKTWAGCVRAKAVPYDTTFTFDHASCPLAGKHNEDNILGAATLALELGIDPDTIKRAIKTFTPLPHRLQQVGVFRGITFYDDAISTTPESTIAGMRALPRVDMLLLGGTDRGYDFSGLVNEIIARNIRIFAFFPETGTRIRAMLKERGYPCRSIETTIMSEAVRFAFANLKPGSVCLLSTASPSYSLWKNFEEKGNQFQDAIRLYDPQTSATPQKNKGSSTG